MLVETNYEFNHVIISESLYNIIYYIYINAINAFRYDSIL